MLSDKEVATLCMNRLRGADSFTQQLQQDRKSALDAYRQELYGDEVDGCSKYVTADVLDTIESMMPQIMEMFVGDDNPVTFEPNSEEDVEAARQETEYVRHVFNKENEGFLILYTWIKDGLLSKNGVVKSYWDERVDEVKETYENKNYFEYVAIMQDPEVEVEAVTIKVGDEEFSLDELEFTPQDALFDIEVVRKEDNSQIRVENVPPENFYVDPDHPSLDLEDVSFCCHRETLTASDLIVDGYDKKLVASIPSGSEDEYNEETVNRLDEDGSIVTDFNDETREIEVYEFYIRIDADEDGKSELRMIKLAGSGGAVVLDNEVVDSIPFDVWTPIPQTHKHYGMSVADLVMPIQKLKTAVMRGMLDNLYLTNNPVKKVNPDLMHNMEDVLQQGAGAIWRTKSPDAVVEHTTPFMGEASLGVLRMIDDMRAERTGVSPVSQGLTPDALADSTNLVGSMVMNQALMRIKMIARVFAETGFKSLMRRIHELCSKYDGKDRMFPLDGAYSVVSPREWKTRKRFSVKVGVGHADRMQRVQAINAILQNHREIVAAGGLDGPLLTINNVHEALTEQAKLLGYMDGRKFYRDPQTYQPPPPKEDPVSEALQIEEAKTVVDTHKEAAKNALELRKHNDEMALQAEKLKQEQMQFEAKLAQERRLKREEMALKYGRELNVGQAQTISE